MPRESGGKIIVVNMVHEGRVVLNGLPAWLKADDDQIDKYVDQNVSDLTSAKLALAVNAKATAKLSRVVVAILERLVG